MRSLPLSIPASALTWLEEGLVVMRKLILSSWLGVALATVTPGLEARAEGRRWTAEVSTMAGFWGASVYVAQVGLGFDPLPILQLDALVGMVRIEDGNGEDFGFSANVGARVRLIRSEPEADTFVGHALVLRGAVAFTEYWTWFEPTVGWQFRGDNGLGVAVELGAGLSLVDEGGMPLARVTFGYSF
jgi:hypothetical protein